MGTDSPERIANLRPARPIPGCQSSATALGVGEQNNGCEEEKGIDSSRVGYGAG